jgi:S1-C subfamily serine protease
MAKVRASKQAGKLTTLAAMLALVLVGGNYYADLKRDQRLSGTETTLRVVRSAFIAPDTIQETEKSVYLVMMKGQPFATAFVVDRARGLLATNSHVARWAGKMGKLSVVGADGTELDVNAVRLHDGYKSFPRRVSAYQPIKTTTGAAGGRAIEIPGLFGMVDGYDVALLQVSMEDAEALAPDLPLASRETLYALRSGDAIASVGYPLDLSSTSAIEAHALTPKATVGRISAMSSFVGVRTGDDSNDAISQLIIHPLHTQPGTSGSPMINDRGEVIAVNSGASARAARDGSIIEAGDRHGQRADILSDLLEGTDSEVVNTLYTPIWDKQLEQFSRMPEVFADIMTALMKPQRDLAKSSSQDRNLTFAPGQGDPVYEKTSSAYVLKTFIELDPNKTHLLFATDYRPGVGACNPIFRIEKGEGIYLTADSINTNDFTIFQLQVPAHSLPEGPHMIEFYEPAACNSDGQTMHLHTYSWSPEESSVAQDRGPRAIATALWQRARLTAKLVAGYFTK